MATKESLTASIKELAAKVTALKQAKESKDVFMPVVKEMQALKAQYDQNAPSAPVFARKAARPTWARAPAAPRLDPSLTAARACLATSSQYAVSSPGVLLSPIPPPAQVQGGDGGGL